MEDEKKEEKPEEKKPAEQEIKKSILDKLKIPKLTKWDKLAIVALVIFVILVSIPVYISKGGCEVARPGYKCASAADVMAEHCALWGKYGCPHCEKNEWEECADPSLPQVEWYISNLCQIHNQYHNAGLDCANLKLACNQITGNQTCQVFV